MDEPGALTEEIQLDTATLIAILRGPAAEQGPRLARALGALEALPLALQRCCNQGGLADPAGLTVSVLDCELTPGAARARLGVFFVEVVGGCNCNDDPVEVNAYCELDLTVADGTLTLRPRTTA